MSFRVEFFLFSFTIYNPTGALFENSKGKIIKLKKGAKSPLDYEVGGKNTNSYFISSALTSPVKLFWHNLCQTVFKRRGGKVRGTISY